MHLGQGATLTVAIPEQQLCAVQEALDAVIQTFADKQAAERPQRWPEMCYTWEGQGVEGTTLEYIEVFCNPNAHSSAFDAQVLITMHAAGGIRLMAEQQLTRFQEELDACGV